MIVGVAAALLVIAVGALLWRLARPARRRDERSIRSHHSTIGVMEHLGDPSERPSLIGGPNLEHPAERAGGHVRVVAAERRPEPPPGLLPPAPPRRFTGRPSFPRSRAATNRLRSGGPGASPPAA